MEEINMVDKTEKVQIRTVGIREDTTFPLLLSKIPVFCKRNPKLAKKPTYDMIIEDALRAYN